MTTSTSETEEWNSAVATNSKAGSIEAIDRGVVHRICSGQVVLNLATAVKELVENSLDAGATAIDVRLREYGAELIEVVDNGVGLEKKNFEALTLKHHTSKLKDFSSLVNVDTFGFRGEALSSLCALSMLSVITCHKSSTIGTKIEYDHSGKIVKEIACARQQGTTVLLKNLFSTLPVRHKEFLRNLKKEFSKMILVLNAYCLISTTVRITCSNQVGNGKRNVLVSTKSNGSQKENISNVYGSKQLSSLLEFKQQKAERSVCEEYNIKEQETAKDLFIIEGFVSSSEHGQGRSAADRQFYYINKRPCDPTKISRLVNEVYHYYNRHQFPFVMLDISLDKESVDVNVTPDKRQIFVQEEKLLLATIKTSLQKMFEPQASTYRLNAGKIQTNMQKMFQPSKIETIDKMSNCRKEIDGRGPNNNNASSSLVNLKRSFSSAFAKDVLPKESKTLRCNDKQRRLDSFVSQTSITDRHPDCKESPPNGELELEILSPGDPSSLEFLSSPQNSLEINLNQKRSFLKLSQSMSFVSDQKVPAASDISLTNSQISITSEEQESSQDSINTLQNQNILLPMSNPDDFGSESKLEFEPKGSYKLGNDFHLGSRMCGDVNVMEQINNPVDDVNISYEYDEAESRTRKSAIIPFSLAKLKQHILKDEGKKEPTMVYSNFHAKIVPLDNSSAEDELQKEISKDMFSKMDIIGQFNLGFIIVKLGSDLFIVDQHATDEKYNFEMLQKQTEIKSQRLIQPQNLEMTAANECVLMDNIEIFHKNGFEFLIDKDMPCGQRVKLVSIPVSKNWIFGKDDVHELIFMLSDSPGILCRPSRVRTMFASRACRKSIMVGTALNHFQMKKLINHMGLIEQPWNCPHGRPTMRHLVNLDTAPRPPKYVALKQKEVST